MSAMSLRSKLRRLEQARNLGVSGHELEALAKRLANDEEPDDRTECACPCADCRAGNCEDCTNPNCDDESCNHDGESEGADMDMKKGGRKSIEVRLDRMARTHASVHKVSYPVAYAAVLKSPRGRALYAKYYFTMPLG